MADSASAILANIRLSLLTVCEVARVWNLWFWIPC